MCEKEPAPGHLSSNSPSNFAMHSRPASGQGLMLAHKDDLPRFSVPIERKSLGGSLTAFSEGSRRDPVNYTLQSLTAEEKRYEHHSA
jgi:hypothetical protein